MKTSVLALSSQRPRGAWKTGCSNLGISLDVDLGKAKPTIAELETFFRSTPDWIYFGGHWGGRELYSNSGDVGVTFNKDGVEIKHIVDGVEDKKIIKKGNGFNLYKNCKVIVWGGCSVLANRESIEVLRKLFNNPLMLGLSIRTGWSINYGILSGMLKKDSGGFGNSQSSNFFNYLNSTNIGEEKTIKDAFLKAAWRGWEDTLTGKNWRAIDSNGTAWGTSRNGPVRVSL